MIPFILLAAVAVHLPARPSPRPVSNLPSACRLLTRSDIQAALGRTVGRPEEDSSPAASTCTYSAPHTQVTVTLQRLDREPDLPTEIAALQRELEGATARPAPAFGPAAFYLEIPGAGLQLHIVTGRTYLLVSLLGFGQPPQIAPALEKLARTALSRR